MPTFIAEESVPEDLSRLLTISDHRGVIDIDVVAEALRSDRVVLIRNLTPEQAEVVISDTAAKFGLGDSLELQAGLASITGHRANRGKYFMTVNARAEYQFITPHSEGSSFSSMQLAAFYCYENTTDGGESVLMNVDSDSPAWSGLRESQRRATVTRPLSRREAARAKVLYQVSVPNGLQAQDRVISEIPTEIPGLTLLEVLAPVPATPCRILAKTVRVYWDSVASIDLTCGKQYGELLRVSELLRVPPDGFDLARLDNAFPRRIWDSGTEFSKLFRCKVTRKLCPGDLMINNNMSWTHSANNWSPSSGTRKIVAAFA